MRKLEITNIAVVPGTSVTITLSDMPLINGKVRHFDFRLTEAQEEIFDTAAGTEPVFLFIGTGTTPTPLLTRISNIFYADRLILGREYTIAYGNNGLPAAVPHFTNFNTPACAKAYNPANIPPPPA